jgi:hypothetical protein
MPQNNNSNKFPFFIYKPIKAILSPTQIAVIKFFLEKGTGKTYLAQNLKNAELDIPAFIKKIRKFANELEESNNLFNEKLAFYKAKRDEVSEEDKIIQKVISNGVYKDIGISKRINNTSPLGSSQQKRTEKSN